MLGIRQDILGLFDEERKLYMAVDFLLGRISPNISVSLREPNGDVLSPLL
ncbi:MAG: hypothetical protein CM15mP115_10810 [Alphaproteobacteria bacterium]|nr:MAG: hypothetical protein CM15mP115_10810 [Alphaproteobacteria bacterium]